MFSGVPQGSVLGPTLFLIYVNDIYRAMEPGITMRLFADDCVIYAPTNKTEDQVKLNQSLQNIGRWCEKHGMQINTDKTMCITVTHRKAPLHFNYTLSGAEIKHVNTVKYLGVTITQSLKWNAHIDQVSARAFKQLGFLRRKLSGTSPQVKLTAYKTLIRPILEYAAIVWNPHQKNMTDALEKIQSRALRFVYSKYGRQDSVSALRLQARVATLASRRRLACLKFLFLLLNNLVNINKDEYLKAPNRHSSRTNNEKCIRPFLSRCNTFKHSFFPSVIEIWNDLPDDVVSAQSLDSFLSLVESHLETFQ